MSCLQVHNVVEILRSVCLTSEISCNNNSGGIKMCRPPLKQEKTMTISLNSSASILHSSPFQDKNYRNTLFLQMLLISQSLAEAPVGISVGDIFVIQKSSLLTVSELRFIARYFVFFCLCTRVHLQLHCNFIAAGDWSSCLHHHHHRLWSQGQ